MKYIVTLNQKDYEVEVAQGTAKVLSAEEAKKPAAPAPNASPAPAAPAPVPAAAAAPAAAGGQTVSAPMPGTVLKVLVSQGQAVKKGDVLLILEAMKMENEIFAPCDGTVASVSVSSGSSVSTGDAMAVIA